MTDNTQSALRLEAASLTAWPAEYTYDYEGWHLRCSAGYTRRANCIIPGADDGGDFPRRIEYAEAVFQRHSLHPIFQLPSFRDYRQLEQLLAARGYTERGGAEVMICPLNEVASVSIESLPRTEWFYCHLRLGTVSNPAGHFAILERMTHPCLYAALEVEGEITACGLAVAQGEFVGLFDIVTDVAHRRRGYGRRLVQGMMAWGKEMGATNGYLQVARGNAAAVALYQQLGFETVYHYRYRIAPDF